MERYYVVKMENGENWGIPAYIIAENKADYYFDRGNNEWNKEYDAMMELFDDGSYKFSDWAKDNMDWCEVEDYAVLLNKSSIEPDYQECWMNGEYEFITLN